MTTKEQLRRMLVRLEDVSSVNEEIFDTECRERVGLAVLDGFARRGGPDVVPNDLGLATEEANNRVRAAIVEFIVDASTTADAIEMSFHDRLNAMQNSNVVTGGGNDYEEFLGHTSPGFYDIDGNVVRTQ